MDARILILAPTIAPGSSGEQVTTWAPLLAGDGKVWGSMRFLSGVETLRAGAVTVSTKASIRIRNRAGVTPAMRAVADGVTYNITGIQPDGKRIWMYLICESIPA